MQFDLFRTQIGTSAGGQPESGSDVAYTPDAVAQASVTWLARQFGPRWLSPWWEPCAGGGAFVRALQTLGPGAATELDPHAEAVRRGMAQAGNALHGPPAGMQPILICTNPPFSLATEILKMALAVPTCQVVALLLLQSWIVPEGHRASWVWGPDARLYRQVVLYPRIAFGGPGRNGNTTDQREYALHVWRRVDGVWNASGPMELERLVWRKKNS